MKSPEDICFSGICSVAVAAFFNGKYKVFMSLCITLKIQLWLILVHWTIPWSESCFFSPNVIKIILTVFVGRGKINSYFIVSYTTLKQQSGFHLN